MAKPVKAKEAPSFQSEPVTCVAFTFQASNDTGSFCNYRICTLCIQDGKIVHIEKSQEFATFEAIARAEVFISASLWNLSSRYQPGLYTALGGDQCRDLIAKLERHDPEALKRVLPVIKPTTTRQGSLQ